MVGWIEVCKGDIVPSVHHEACNVKGSKVDPTIRVEGVVAGSTEMVQASRNVHNEMTVDEDL